MCNYVRVVENYKDLVQALRVCVDRYEKRHVYKVCVEEKCEIWANKD